MIDFIAIALRAIRAGMRPLAALIFARVIILIQNGVKGLLVFPNAKIAIIGYDYLFPSWMSYAMQVRQIRVVAAQERLMLCFFPAWPLILDQYFVHGGKTIAALQNNPVVCVDTFVTSGDIRADLLMQKTSRHDGFPVGFDHATLVLDWHSQTDLYSNNLFCINSWENNKIFYEAVLRLAKLFPRSCFLIRGKNVDWLEVEALFKIRDKVLEQPNIKIDQNYEEFHISNKLAAASDSIIARHTSLGDQALSIGKPVIYIDWTSNGCDCMSTVCNFSSHKIFARSETDLKDMYTKIIDTGYILDVEAQKNLVDEYFNGPYKTGQAKRIVMRHLKNLLNE